MSLPSDVTVSHVAERPTAVIAATTTWHDFPTQWKPMLDQVYVYACLQRHGSVRQGCNVMLYKDDMPHVEVSVEQITPWSLTVQSSGRGYPRATWP